MSQPCLCRWTKVALYGGGLKSIMLHLVRVVRLKSHNITTESLPGFIANMMLYVLFANDCQSRFGSPVCMFDLLRHLLCGYILCKPALVEVTLSLLPLLRLIGQKPQHLHCHVVDTEFWNGQIPARR